MMFALRFKTLVSVLVISFASLSAQDALANVYFDAGTGTAAPPSTIANYDMTPFPDDTRSNGVSETGVASPLGGTVGFSNALNHVEIGSGWATWSHGYTGDVYIKGGASVTLTMPAGTGAFYMYVEPNNFSTFDFVATSDKSSTSGTLSIEGDSGATFVGFYADCGEVITQITITNTDGSAAGFAIGEFGIEINKNCVPAVSEWGMASVVLLLLTGLTIRFGALKLSRKAA